MKTNTAKAPRTYRPRWADDANLAAHMVKVLGQIPGFESFEGGRDMLMEKKGIPLEEANGVMVIVGLQRLAELTANYQDAVANLGALVFDGIDVDAHWIAREFHNIGRPVDEYGVFLDGEVSP